MPHVRQQLGSQGEAVAREQLERQGFSIIAQNWHAGRYGELDLIALHGAELVFVEVKTRRGTDFGQPEEAVTKLKQAKLKAAAQAFLMTHPQLPQAYRIDVVAVVLAPSGEVNDFKHYIGAVAA